MKLLAAFQHDSLIMDLAFDPNGETLLLGSSRSISVRSVPKLEEQTAFSTGITLFGCAFHPNGTTIAIYGCEDPDKKLGVLRILELPQGKLKREFPTLNRETLLAGAFSPDGTRFLAAGGHEVLWIFHLENGTIEFGSYSGEAAISLSFHPDGKTLLFLPCWQGGGCVKFLELEERLVQSPLPRIDITSDSISAASFSPDGHHFAFAHQFARLYNYPQCERLLCFDAEGKVCFPVEQSYTPKSESY